MLWLPGLRPRPHWGSLQRSPRPSCWNKHYFIRNNYKNSLEKAILNLLHQISDCIKELFMLVTAYAQHDFLGLKSIKTLVHLLLDLAPLSLNALAPALVRLHLIQNLFVNLSIKKHMICVKIQSLCFPPFSASSVLARKHKACDVTCKSLINK